MVGTSIRRSINSAFVSYPHVMVTTLLVAMVALGCTLVAMLVWVSVESWTNGGRIPSTYLRNATTAPIRKAGSGGNNSRVQPLRVTMIGRLCCIVRGAAAREGDAGAQPVLLQVLRDAGGC